MVYLHVPCVTRSNSKADTRAILRCHGKALDIDYEVNLATQEIAGKEFGVNSHTCT